MYRYRLTAYFEDRATQAQVAQTVIVIAADDKSAIDTVKSEVARDAVDGKVRTLQVLEKEQVTPGVKFRSDPYIPFSRPASHGTAGLDRAPL